MKIGILALQGASEAHRAVLDALDETTIDVRTPADLSAVDGVILPGGESTTMSFLLDSSGLREPLRERLADGLPAFGTCAGASRPVFPGMTTSGTALTAVATTGMPQLIASTTAQGSPS